MSKTINAPTSGLKLVEPPKRPGSFATLNISTGSRTADIEIRDVIGDEWDGMTAKQLIEEIKGLPAGIETINVEISSPGGSVWQAIDMYNALKAHPATVNTSTVSICGSAAVIVFLAGDNRIAGPYADFYIHKPSNCMCGNAEDFRDVADRLDRDQEKILNIYVDNGCKEREELNDMMNAATWFNADEAVDRGFATEKSDKLEAVACLFDLETLNGCPDHHKRIANAAKKRQQEQAERDAGLSAKEAKKKVSNSAERDAGSVDVTKELCALIQQMEIQ